MSTLEARIAEVLVDHRGHVFFNVSGDNKRWSDKCICGVELFGSENSPEYQMYPGVSYADCAHAAHQAAMLAPVILEAQAEALRDAADGFRNCPDWGFRATRPMATEDYLRNLADSLATS